MEVESARRHSTAMNRHAAQEAKRARIAGVNVAAVAVEYTTEDDEDEKDLVEKLADELNTDDLDMGDGEELEEERVKANRRKEVKILAEMGVFEVVRREGVERHKILGTRMVDTNEKRRFVAKEIATYKTTDFYAQASTSATVKMIDIYACKQQLSRGVLDVVRAFLNVPEEEEIYCEPPEIWLEDEGHSKGSVLWKLVRVLYGRRKAAKAWVAFLAAVMEHIGFIRCAAAPQLFKMGSLLAEAHMDDVHFAGQHLEIRSFVKEMESRIAIKPPSVVVFGDEGSYSYLRRERRVCKDGCWILPSPAIIQRCAAALGVDSATSMVGGPLTAGDRGDGDEEENGEKLSEKEHALYKTVVGALLHIRLDRQDVAFAVRLAAKRIRGPTVQSMIRVKRIVKFLWVTRDVGIFIENGGGVRDLVVDCDADWAETAETG